MQSLYAVQFTVQPNDQASDIKASVALQDSIIKWISGWYHKRGYATSFSNKIGELAPRENHHLSIVSEQVQDEDISDWLLNWSYPDSDPLTLWHTSCEIAEACSEIELSLTIHLESREFVITPQTLVFNRPAVVPRIIESFPCFINGRRISTKPTVLGVGDISTFVDETLKTPYRRLPVALFSTDPYTDRPMIDPAEAADRLAGLAEVFVLADKWASFELTDAIGKTMSCYNGAVRLYFPRFSETSGFRECPVYLPERLAFESDGAFSGKLLRWLASMATVRFTPGNITKSARTAIQHYHSLVLQEHEAAYEKLRQEALEKQDVEELYRISDNERTTLKQENVSLLSRVRVLERDLIVARENIQSIWAELEQEHQVVEPSILVETKEEEFASVAEAVEKAAREFQDTLLFLEEAFKSAKDSPYRQPEKVFRAFDAMNEVCQARRQSIARKEPMGPLENLFQAKGFEYAPHISATSRGKFGTEYTANYEGKIMAIEEHLVLGNGDPNVCLRIHFFWDQKKQKFVVAHAGRHKTNTKT